MNNDLFKASAFSVTAFGLLSVAGLLAAGLVLGDIAVVLFALLSAGSSYLAMFVVMLALTNDENVGIIQFATFVNPIMTLVSCAFWALGFFQLWG